MTARLFASTVPLVFITGLIGCGSDGVPSGDVVMTITDEPPPVHVAAGLRLVCHPVLDSKIAEVASEAKDSVFLDGKLAARWTMLTADAPKDDVVVRSVDRKKEILVLLRRFNIETVHLKHARANGAFVTLTMWTRLGGKKLSTLTRNEALAHADEKPNRRLAVIIGNTVMSLKRIMSQIPSADPVELELDDENVAFLAALAINQAIANQDTSVRTKQNETAPQEK